MYHWYKSGIILYCICMFLWCVAVLELGSHPDHNKEPGSRTLCWFKDPSNRSLILAILHSRQLTFWLHKLCLEVLAVHGSEFRLFDVNAFSLLGLPRHRIHYLLVSIGCATCYATGAGHPDILLCFLLRKIIYFTLYVHIGLLITLFIHSTIYCYTIFHVF